MPSSLTRRALVASLALALSAGAACSSEDDGDDEAGGGASTTTVAPDPTAGRDDDALGELCVASRDFAVDGDPALLEEVRDAADELGDLDGVVDAATFLVDHPDPTSAEDQRQAEDAHAILRADVVDAGLCDRIDEDGRRIADADFTAFVCDEWDEFQAAGDFEAIRLVDRNTDAIGLDEEAAGAVASLVDPDIEPDQREVALSVATAGFADVC